ncbi:MAG: GH92 family glycosyl hydrolase [Deltaproteobacteria bacterium]|nr:GH92 family glycosyl hydrolase [Deltaproteobacteria bacterium]
MLLFLACLDPESPAPRGVDLVDPFIATGGPGFRVGSATPAATVPFGMVKLGPDTALENGGIGPLHCGGYYYTDTHLDGFSHTHMHGVGVPALGNILFFPGDGLADTVRGPDDWRTTFSHDDEVATPGYYAVTLGNGVRVELSATMHAGQHRYTYPEGADPTLVIDLGYNLYGQNLGAKIRVEENVVSGFMTNDDSFGGHFPVYFYAVFDTSIESASTWTEGEVLPGAPAEAEGAEVGAVLRFSGTEVRARVGVSLVDVAAAQANLGAELAVDQSLDATASQAEQTWAEAIDGFSVEGGTTDQQIIYFTALYHLLQMPTQYSDADGRYVGFDGQVHDGGGRPFHSDLSLWDTYRTAHPAFDLFFPEKASDFATSLLRMAQQGGAFPRWPVAQHDGSSMIGAPADIALADAIVKDVVDWPVSEAWPLMVAQATGDGEFPYNARPGIAEVESMGYLPADYYGGSVAWLQELAWADDALANAAEALGDHERSAHFSWRSYSYRNVYDPEIGYFHERYSDGSFADELNPLAWEDEFVEGNAEQYLYLAPWDADGLAALLGGEQIARERLENFMMQAVYEGPVVGPGAYYWHGNEPDIHAPWLFALWGDRERAVYWVDWVMESQYDVDPDGLAGNDDAGTLSAWYLFAALGFYPIAGTTHYVLGAPIFDTATFPLVGGHFTVRKEGDGRVVERVTIDGVELSGPTFEHHRFTPGGEMVFYMEG